MPTALNFASTPKIYLRAICFFESLLIDSRLAIAIMSSKLIRTQPLSIAASSIQLSALHFLSLCLLLLE